MTGSAKSEALARIAAIATEYHITANEITDYFSRSEKSEHSGAILGRILGYVGGAFIFGGLVLYAGMQWESLSSAARVIITFGSGLVAFILGFFSLDDSRYRNSSTPLFLAAAALQPTGMFVFLSEYSNGNDLGLACIVVYSLMAMQFLAAFFKHRRTSLLFCGYLFYNAALAVIFDRAGVSVDTIGIIIGGSILLVTNSIDKGPHRAMASLWYIIGGLCYYTALGAFLARQDMGEPQIGIVVSLSLLCMGYSLTRQLHGVLGNIAYILGSGLLLGAAYDLLARSAWDIGLLALSVAMMFFSVQMRSRSLLLVNTLGLFSFLGYYTQEYFSNVVGWPLALILLGFLMVGISALAIKLDRRIKSGQKV